jgi:hypothetical protein
MIDNLVFVIMIMAEMRILFFRSHSNLHGICILGAINIEV